MNMQFDSPKKKVVLEGCNGEWAQRSYLPFLAKKAANEEIELWAVDIQDALRPGSPPLERNWQAAYDKNKAHYLSKIKDVTIYNELSNADFVFIVAPDRYHCQIAELWLERLSPEGKIFIEKPLDASVESALNLKREIDKGKGEAVFSFDHYLARAYYFLQYSSPYFKQIGSIKKIEFCLLEDSGIDPERKGTLDKGMLFDLFCHVLAAVDTVVKHNTGSSETKLQEVGLKKVKGAQYKNSPITGETFAYVKFTVNRCVEVESTMGKCVGTSPNKFMRVTGANGEAELNFAEDKFSVFDLPPVNFHLRHVDPFLEAVLMKRPPLLIAGVLSFDAALEILKTLEKAKELMGTIGKYDCGQSKDVIRGKIP